MFPKDTEVDTEVYVLEGSNPRGKVVIRKGRDLVFVWPGDLSKLIDDLIEVEWNGA